MNINCRGSKPSDTASDIKKAYRKAALKHHPDKVYYFLDLSIHFVSYRYITVYSSYLFMFFVGFRLVSSWLEVILEMRGDSGRKSPRKLTKMQTGFLK